MAKTGDPLELEVKELDVFHVGKSVEFFYTPLGTSVETRVIGTLEFVEFRGGFAFIQLKGRKVFVKIPEGDLVWVV